jgi:hypothetical protein
VESSNVLNDQPIHREHWNLFPALSINVLAFKPIGDPALANKVDSLSNIKACTESSMVRTRECEYKFSRLLESLEDLHLLLYEVSRVNHCHNVKQNVWVFLENQSQFSFNSSIKLLSVTLWHTVPEFRFAPMVVVNRVKHEVFIVPAE